MAITSLQDLFEHTLQDIYYAERHGLQELGDLPGKTDSSELKTTLEAHGQETKKHIERLEQAFKTLGKEPKGEKCDAMVGIVKETKSLIDEVEDADTRDAAIIAASQAIDHYEITRYGTLVSWADLLGHKEVANLLRQNLESEKDSDGRLTRLAEDHLNKQAA